MTEHVDPVTGFHIRNSGSAPEQPSTPAPAEPDTPHVWGTVGQGALRAKQSFIPTADMLRDQRVWDEHKQTVLENLEYIFGPTGY